MARDNHDVADLLSEVKPMRVPKATRGGGTSKYEPLAEKLAEMYQTDDDTGEYLLDEDGNKVPLAMLLEASKANSIAQQLNKIGRDRGWRFRTRSSDASDPQADRYLFCDDNEFDWDEYELEKQRRRHRSSN